MTEQGQNEEIRKKRKIEGERATEISPEKTKNVDEDARKMNVEKMYSK